MLDLSLYCMAPTEHLKMMRLLFLFLLLLLPAATVDSEEIEGSGGDDDGDDEDFYNNTVKPDSTGERSADINVDRNTGKNQAKDNNNFTLIVIIAAVTVLTLSVAAIVTIMLVRRHMQYRQQGIYSVPTEQDQKGAVPFLVE